MKKAVLYPLRAVEGLFDRLLAAAGALFFVQFPQFYAQYLQRLGGHLDEANRIVSEYAKAAASNQLSLAQYIQMHLASDNSVFVSTGKVINGAVERLQHLEAAYRALKGANAWTRVWTFIRYVDPSIARQTWNNFTPGVPTTIEALIYALIGILIVWGAYKGIKKLAVLIYRKATAPRPILPRTPDIAA